MRRTSGLLRRPILFLAACVLAQLSSGPRAAQAQTEVYLGADIAYSNRYVWRGITRTSHKVFQPEALVSISAGRAFITGGVWASLEPLKSDSGQLSDTGVGERGFGEINYWLEYQRGFGLLEAAVGWTLYRFDNDAAAGGRTGDFDTSELYGRLEVRSAPISPKLAIWYDVDRLDGAYVETSADLQVPLLPVASLYMTGLAGWSVGQSTDPGEPRSGYFAEDGLTHVDLSAWASVLIAGGFSIAPALHVQFNRDASTKVTGPDPGDADRSRKVWFTVAVSWLGNLGAAP